MTYRAYFITLLLALTSFQVNADPAKVAVASNFTQTIKALADAFKADTGEEVQLVFGSTGKLYAQIQHGAPFDAFFAADTERPQLLEQENRIQPDSRFTYARGKLALWSHDPDLVDANGAVLKTNNFRHLAIANPKLAPYGLAAQQTLTANGQWQTLQAKIVQGENIGQTFQFINSGNAELGFVALSQLQQLDSTDAGSVWIVPSELYDAIDQQAVQLTDNAVASDFLTFVKSPAAQKLIRSYGYDTP